MHAAETSAQPANPETYSLWLDALRWPAALLVVVGHAGQVFLTSVEGRSVKGAFIHYAYSFVAGFAHTAVIVFFVLSGYLVGGSVVKTQLRRTFDPSDYMLRRLSRLWIVLLPALGLTIFLKICAAWIAPNAAALVYAGAPTGVLTAGDFACNAAFLQLVACERYGGNFALWSLTNEFWYYVFFPGLFALMLRPVSAMAWLYTALMAGLLVVFSLNSQTPASIAPYFLIWALGVAAFVAPARSRLNPKLCLALFAAIVVIVRLVGGKRLVETPSWQTFVCDFVIASAFSSVLVALKSATNLRPPMLGRLNTTLANFSYSLYCTHIPLLFFISALFLAWFGNGWHMVRDAPETWLFTAAGIGLTLAGSWVFSLATEANTDRVRRFFERRLLGKTQPNDRDRWVADNPTGPS